MTKATEIKLENDRDDSESGFRDRRRSLTLVPSERKSVTTGRSFNIDVADNMFSPRVAVVDRSRLAVETKQDSNDGRPLDTPRTVATVLFFIAAGALGYLIGRGGD